MLILAATPIGNLADASKRLIQALTEAKVIAAEDTRMVQKLAQGLAIELNARLISLNDHNEREKVDQLVAIAQNEDLLLVSDAGMPTISDPGFVLVRAMVQAGVEVSVIPGPSAVLAALAVAGLPTDRFSFEGFIPRKESERQEFFKKLINEERTMVFFETANRLADSITSAKAIFGEQRPASVSRELTKKFEETFRGSLEELAEWANLTPKGELVLVIAGQTEKAAANLTELVEIVEALRGSGKSLKDAVAVVAKLAGVSKSALYDQTIASRAE
ncbi:MAG: 16S rRNA (cytidine(1402)-2'-O)-methyltransferase [Rhodoluna sp.]|jgi:16S rRNA (cytidine1402-2'-O)-methyltransferase